MRTTAIRNGRDGLRSVDYATLQQCMHCGMCLPTCPTYTTTLRERNSPRGRIALMRAVVDGKLAVGQGLADEMSYCLGCLACQTACPAGVDYATLFEAARSDVRQQVPVSRASAFWRWLVFRQIFMRPRLLRWLARGLRLWQRLGLDRFSRSTGLNRILPTALGRLEPQAPRIGSAFSYDLIARVETPTDPPRYHVALLTGCVQDVVFADVNRATVDVLLANGCRVSTPRGQSCCGSLHAHAGDLAAARDLARRMLTLFADDYDAIITNAGGCGLHLRRYGHLLRDDPEFSARAEAWDAKVHDIHEWLVKIQYRVPGTGPFETSVDVTYHDSCHLVHGQRVSRQPREILGALPGVRLHELPEANVCCGSAGVYNVTQPDESARLLARKVTQIRGTGATVVAAANPGCHLQLARGLTQDDPDITVHHPISLLALAYCREDAMKARPS